MCSYGPNPYILRPMRVTKHSKTLIEKFWCNCVDPSSNLNSGVILLRLSENFRNFVQFTNLDSAIVGDDTYIY